MYVLFQRVYFSLLHTPKILFSRNFFPRKGPCVAWNTDLNRNSFFPPFTHCFLSGEKKQCSWGLNGIFIPSAAHSLVRNTDVMLPELERTIFSFPAPGHTHSSSKKINVASLQFREFYTLLLVWGCWGWYFFQAQHFYLARFGVNTGFCFRSCGFKALEFHFEFGDCLLRTICLYSHKSTYIQQE